MRKFYRLKILTLCLTLLMAAVSAYAVPAKPTPIKVKQADGTELTIKKFGDEFFNWTTTTDGYNVAQKNGVYYYVNVNANGTKVVSNQKANQVKTAQEISFLTSFNNVSMASMAQGQASAARSQRSPEKLGNFPSKGKLKSIILLVQYKDVKFGLTDPKAAFTKSLNESGYSDNGGTGSAKDYYADNSRGAFDGEFVVEGPFTLSEDMAYYGGNDANGNDLRPREMAEEAVSLADATVDFSQFDYDNDGVIDNVFIYYAGYNEAEGGPAESIWPHRWNARNSVVVDGKRLDGYACSSEFRGTSGDIQAGIGTFCHEFGHVFGLHDLYDTDYEVNGSSPGLGAYDVMTSGSYSNDGCTPPLFNALQRVDIGWADPIVVDKSGDFTVKTAKNGDVYRINSDIEGEYFLIENRLKSDIVWEKFIPGSGLSIMHIDRSAPYMSRWNGNRVNAYAAHQCAKYIYANNKLASAADWASIFYKPGKSWTATSTPKNAGWSGKANPVAITSIAAKGTDYVFRAVRYDETSVVGYVTDAMGAPVEGAVITLIKSSSDKASGLTLSRASDPNVYTTTSDADGMYSIKADPGSYVLTASKTGYSAFAKSLEVEQGQYRIDISLNTIEQANFEKKTYQTGTAYTMLNFGANPYGAYTYYSAEEMKKFIDYDMRQARVYVLAPSTVTLKVLSAKDITKVLYTKQATSEDAGYVTFEIAEGDLPIEAGKNYYVGFEVSSRYTNYLAIDDATTRRANVSDIVYFSGKWSTISTLAGQTVPGNIMIDIFMGKPADYVDPVSITLPTTANVLMKGTMQLTATVLPAGSNQFVEWSSNNTDVATVDKTGKVIGVNEGTATITAVSPINNKVVAKCEVTVGEAKLASATGVVTGFDDAKLVGATVTFVDRAVKTPATNTSVKSKKIDPSTVVRKSAKVESLSAIQMVTKQTVTDKDGVYSMKDLYAGVGYDIYVEAAEDKYDPTAFGLSKGLAEGANTLNLPGVLENPVFGKDLHQYHTGVYTNAVGTAGESEFAIRLKKEDLVDFVGDKFLAVNFTVSDLRQPFAVVAIYYGDALKPVTADYAMIGTGLNRMMLDGLEAGIPADMDIVIGVTVDGRMGMDNAAKAEDGGNLIWADNTWTPVSEMGDFTGNWMIGVYTEDAEPTPVEAFEIVVPKDQVLTVGSEMQLDATYAPWNATYIIPAWTSSNEKLATIDENGLVKGIAEGTVTITATAKDKNGIVATLELPVVLKQAITGKVTNVEGGIGAGAKLRFLPITKSEVGSGSFKAISYQDVATKADIIETVANDKGVYDVEIPEGDYRVEVSSEGCVDVKEMITITKGLNVKDFNLITRFFTTSVEHSYSDKTQKNAVGAGGASFGAFAKWSSKDLKDPKDTKITRITAILATACDIEMMILIDGNINKPVYKKAVKVTSPGQVVLSLTPEEAVTIEAGKEIYVGYILKEGYGDSVFPASTGSNATVDGKGNMLYDGGWMTLKAAGLEGNWMVSMYTQTAEQIKGVEMVAGQIDANLSWNAAGFTQFKVSYNEKVEGATPVVAELDQAKFVFTNLKPGTTYEYVVVGVPTEEGAKELELVKSEFQTIDKVVSTPIVYLTKNTYSVGEMLILKAINIEGDEKITWYLNDVEQDYLEVNLTKKGSFVIKSKIEKAGQKTVYTVKQIVVN